MSNWIDFAKTSDIPFGKRLVKLIQGNEIAVFNLNNEYYAILNECPHAYLPFAEEGMVEGTSITCPHHGAQFCLKTGAVEAPPAFDNLTCYPTRIENNKIQIALS